jgi:hypothetical protein
MSVIKPKQKKLFSMNVEFPFILYDYTSDNRRHVSVDFLILNVPKDMLRPKMAADGSELHLGLVVPPFFARADRVMVVNEGDSDFGKDTHKSNAFKEAARKLHEHHQSFDDEKIMGAPQIIALPFKCEENIVDWELHAYDNESEEMTEDLGSPQFYLVLSVDLVSIIKPREKKKKGGFRVIKSPARPMEEERDYFDGL